jgi:hypothetical protein
MRAPTEQVISISRLICVGCGSETNATCNCGMEYRPKSVLAREAVEAHPEKSDRAIAKEIGASPTTVGRAREELSIGGQLQDGPRIGLDGKARKLPEPKPEDVIDALKKAGVEIDEEEDTEERVSDDYADLVVERNKLQTRVSDLTEALNAKEKTAERNFRLT